MKNQNVAFVLFCIFLFSIGSVEAQYSINWDNRSDLRYDNTHLSLSLDGYTLVPVSINGADYFAIALPGGGYSAEKGYPDLPSINKPVIIPDNQKMDISVISSEYVDIPVSGIAPSKGPVYRNMDANSIPYSFNSVYSQDAWYPNKIVKLGTPFIFRDFRGSLMQVSPFQYNPVKKILRVYSKISVQIISTGSDSYNVLTRSSELKAVDAEYDKMYNSHFVNYNSSRYPIIAEGGSLLILSPASFMSTLAPFVEWKKKKGIATTLVDVATAGKTADEIKKYIETIYNNPESKLTYVLLVGDNEQIPTFKVTASINNSPSNAGADEQYSELKGTDCYGELIIARFSGTTAADIKTQVDRSIYYETKLTKADTWLSNVLLTASNDQRTNKWNETDVDFINKQYNTLKTFGYTNLYRLNQTASGTGIELGTVASVTAKINAGVGMYVYSDHGKKTEWSATSFSNSSVSGLTNENKLFFTYAVACNIGEFNTTGGDCLDEVLMKAQKNGNPTGAIGCYGSTILQWWDPPYAGVREVVDIISNKYPTNIKTTLGGLCINGGMMGYELCPNEEGISVVRAWSLLGDPTLQVYTKTPSPISITHPASLPLGNQTATVTGTEGALVCLYMPKSGIQATGIIKNGSVAIPISVKAESLYVTATLYNYETYQGSIKPDGTNLNFITEPTMALSAKAKNAVIVYQIPQTVMGNGMAKVCLNIYDLKGALVSSLVNGVQSAGTYSVSLNNAQLHLSKGVYLATIDINNFRKTMKLMLR